MIGGKFYDLFSMIYFGILKQTCHMYHVYIMRLLSGHTGTYFVVYHIDAEIHQNFVFAMGTCENYKWISNATLKLSQNNYCFNIYYAKWHLLSTSLADSAVIQAVLSSENLHRRSLIRVSAL